MNEKQYKHLTQQDRNEIQECLNKGMRFKDIGKRIEKEQTTLSREVKKHIKTFANSYVPFVLSIPIFQNYVDNALIYINNFDRIKA